MLQLIRLFRVKTGVNSYNQRQYYKTYGMYKCHCGKEVQLKPSVSRQRVSCGCMYGGKTHGLCATSGRHLLYGVWNGIKSRCYNPNFIFYHRYGGRGIFMCESWRCSFLNFYSWAIENGWKQGFSIERTDNNDGYNPSNCCFIPRKRQARNRVTSKLTINQVREIRASYDAGLETNAALARRYNIRATTMCKIVHHQIWKED